MTGHLTTFSRCTRLKKKKLTQGPRKEWYIPWAVPKDNGLKVLFGHYRADKHLKVRILIRIPPGGVCAPIEKPEKGGGIKHLSLISWSMKLVETSQFQEQKRRHDYRETLILIKREWASFIHSFSLVLEVSNTLAQPEAGQTRVAREGCNVSYIMWRAGVALQATVENIRDFVWEIYYWDLRTLNNAKPYFFLNEMASSY